MSYPVTFQVEYPERLSRLTTFFRAFMLIPQAIVYVFVSIAGYVIMFLSWWAILFTGRYPKTFFSFITWCLRWGARLSAYYALLTDKYPPFSGRDMPDYPVIFNVEPAEKLNRLTTFFRFPVFIMPNFVIGQGWHWQVQPSAGMPMTIPHLIILYFISIAAAVIMFLSWWAILFTGRYPKAFFNFITWWLRWSTRVSGYSYLVTDKYPPFNGSE